MAVEDISTYDNNKNLSLPVPTIEVEGFSGWESQLCVPQDSLEDIDWFPNFTDQIISLDSFSLTPEHESLSLEVQELKTPKSESEDEDENKNEDKDAWKSKSRSVIEQTIAFSNKKQRTKRGGKRGYSSIKQEMDSTKLEVVVNIAELNSDIRPKCNHCLAENTPQWRMGPLGPKTLCNACGMQYKSGRLVPEYRPAASPTFDTVKHSNFHKKILRRRDLSG